MEEELLRKISLLHISEKNQYVPAELHVVMIGKTGNGKSSTGNTILGKPDFKKSFHFNSCTKTAEFSQTEFDGHIIKVMDTPGLFDTRSGMSNDNILLEIAKTAMNFPSGVHVFILVFSCSNRCTQEEEETLKAIEKRFGKRIYQHCLLIFTRAAEFLDANITLGELMLENNFLLNLMHKVGGRAIATENLDKSGDFDYRRFITQAMFEVVKRNNGSTYSGELFEKAREEYETEIIRQASLSQIRKLPLKLMTNFLVGNNEEEHPIDAINQQSVINAIKAHNFCYVTDKDIRQIVSKFFAENAEDILNWQALDTSQAISELEQQEEKQNSNEELRGLIKSIIEAEMNAYVTTKSKKELCSIVTATSMGRVPEDLLSIVFDRLPADKRPRLGKHDEDFNEIVLEILKDKQNLVMNIIGNTSKVFGFLLGDVWAPVLSATRSAFKNWFPFKSTNT